MSKKDDFENAADAFKREDYETAYKLFLPLAEQGDAKAQYKLGSMYGHGRGVPQDYEEAEKLLGHFLAQGYSIIDLYPYTDKTDDLSHWCVRIDHLDKGGEIIPISLINGK